MRVTDDGVWAALHDDAYRYAFRRSLSTRLASVSALEAVRSLDTAPSAVLHGSGGRIAAARDASGTTSAKVTVPSAGEDGDDGRVAVLTAARAVLERYLPPTLPPRVEGEPDLQAALASLLPGERELLLLYHWDGLTAVEAARASGQDAEQLSIVEVACAGRVIAGDATAESAAKAAALQQTGAPAGSPPEAQAEAPAGAQAKAPAEVAACRHGPAIESLVAALHAADPARTLTESDLALSRRGLPIADPAVVGEPEAVLTRDLTDDAPTPPTSPSTTPRSRRTQSIVGAICLLALVAVLAGVLIPRTTPGPAGEAARLFGLADVVAVVSATSVEPTLVDGEMRILQSAPVVQIVKGEAEEDSLTIDVTGRSTLERPYSRNFFPPNQLMFLVRDDSGVLSPIEGERSVLILVDRRSPEATTITGDPAPLPDELRDAIDAMPEEELILGTSGRGPGALDPESIVGILPADGRDSQNLPDSLLGTFRATSEGDRACVAFEFNGRSVLIRWPEGFTAYRREQTQSFGDGDSSVDRRILTVLNERGYPYVDENRSTPFIRGVPTGGRGRCGGQELEVWDIAVFPVSTLLFY